MACCRSRRSRRSADRLLRWLLLPALGGAALLATVPARALVPELRLNQLQHSAWLTRDGAPTDIMAIRQTADGFLWLGTISGLVRFDGVQFERIDLFPQGGGPGRAQNVASLMVDREGVLWVGFRLAGVMRRGPGAQQRWWDWNSGLPIGTVFSLLQDAQGQVWAATSRGLYTLRGERWAAVGAEAGLQPGLVDHLLLDARQTLWVHGTGHRWFARAAGAARFEHQPAMDGVRDAALGQDGQLWLLDNDGRLRRQGTPAARGLPSGVDGPNASLLADQDGGLWVMHNGSGLRRLARPPQPGEPAAALERLDRNLGLSGDRVQTAYQDRQGHLWLGTTAGLDHLRPARAVLVPFADGASAGALAPSDDGSVIAASVTQPATRLRPFGGPQVLPGDYRDGDVHFGTAWRDVDGSVWVGGVPDLWQYTGGRMQRRPAPADMPPNRPVQAVGRDGNGQLWAAWVPGPMRRYTGSGWAPPAPAEQGEIVMALYTDAQGGFWRGLTRGEVVRRDRQGAEQRWGRDQGLALGMVLCLLVDADEVWVGGEAGVALRMGGRFVPLKLQGEPPLRSVSGLLKSPDGALWLNAESGILRVSPAQLQAWRAQPDRPVTVTRLDWRDGVLGPAPQIRELPSAVAGSDGRLWFDRGQGIYWVNPAQPTTPAAVPAVQVTGLWVDGQALPAAAEPVLPVAPQALRIGYTAPLPGAALQLQYRARLLGLDERWQDMGARRELVFNRLPPGDYRLELQAMLGEQGRSAVTTLALRVPPAFHQTLWFRALLAMLALGAGVGLYRWRVAAHCRRVQERLEARLTERERIARELHDTLLQGTQALSLQIEASLQDLPADDPRRQRLSHALDRADATLVDARERVQDLRRHQQPAELSQALQEAVAVLRGEQPLPVVQAKRHGAARPLVNAIWHEAFRLGLEAAQNALHHARCQTLTVSVHYGADALVLTVADDGVGLPAAGAGTAELAAPGHFGLRGLRERARQMGGTLEIVSAPGQGTLVRLRVRASGAYAASAGWRNGWRERWRALRQPDPAQADTA